MLEKQKAIQHWREKAESYMNANNCRWSEACLAIKRQHPESRDAFGAPPKLEKPNANC